MKQPILVTGASGVLGRELVAQLVAAGYTVRAMSRHPPSHAASDGVSWVRADLASGAGLAEALAGVGTIIHAASDPTKQAVAVDVAGTQRLVAHAQAANVAHLVYVSIVGIERIPVDYYRHKLAAEQMVIEGAVPWSIQRATQFHQLVDGLLQRAARLPLLPLPTDMQVQPLAPSDLAGRLCAVVRDGPLGRLPDYGGPEVRPLGDLARAWLTARGLRRPVLHLPLPGAAARALRHGENCCPGQPRATITWEDWLAQRYGAKPEVAMDARHE